MKNLAVLCVAMVIGLLSSQIFAEKSSSESPTCPAKCASAGEATCAGHCEGECEGQCPVSTAMAALPQMSFRVGDESLCCDKAAEKLAEEKKEHVHFVVAEKEYHEQPEAIVALADATEEFVKDFVTPHTCEVSGKTSVCGSEACCSSSAEKLAAVATAAMEEVQLAYQVGDEKCSCPNKADALAKESGAKKLYVIGDTSTCCSVDARIKLAHAKYKAAVVALTKAKQTAKTATATTSS